jgi:RecB family exonuclease
MPSRLRLSTQERDSLRALGVTLPDLGGAMEGEAARWRRPLEMATRSLVLVCPSTGSTGEPNFPHPLWDELHAAMPRPDDAVKLETRRMMVPVSARRALMPPRALPVPTVEVRIGSAIAMRERESPSSLERLFGCSMAWALHYHGKLQPGRSAGPGAPSPLLYGKLAHALLALVFADGALGADAAATRAQLVVETELANLCESLGLPRYHVERTAVKQAIVRTARELGALFAATGASVRGVEHEMTGVLEGVEVSGRADLVLSSPDVVIDLKWGRSSSYDKLLDGSALQLAVYAELHATNGSLPEVAYLTLQRQELLGQVGSTLPGIRILGTANARDTWSGARVALAARQAELASGVLIAPAADGTELESGLVGGRLTIAPGCKYCALSGLCGQGGYK